MIDTSDCRCLKRECGPEWPYIPEGLPARLISIAICVVPLAFFVILFLDMFSRRRASPAEDELAGCGVWLSQHPVFAIPFLLLALLATILILFGIANCRPAVVTLTGEKYNLDDIFDIFAAVIPGVDHNLDELHSRPPRNWPQTIEQKRQILKEIFSHVKLAQLSRKFGWRILGRLVVLWLSLSLFGYILTALSGVPLVAANCQGSWIWSHLYFCTTTFLTIGYGDVAPAASLWHHCYFYFIVGSMITVTYFVIVRRWGEYTALEMFITDATADYVITLMSTEVTTTSIPTGMQGPV